MERVTKFKKEGRKLAGPSLSLESQVCQAVKEVFEVNLDMHSVFVF